MIIRIQVSFVLSKMLVSGSLPILQQWCGIGPTDHPYERPSLHHFTYRQKMYGFSDQDDGPFFEQRESQITTIGHDTWIGHGAIIQPGVTVGDGAIVGSGAM